MQHTFTYFSKEERSVNQRIHLSFITTSVVLVGLAEKITGCHLDTCVFVFVCVCVRKKERERKKREAWKVLPFSSQPIRHQK